VREVGCFDAAPAAKTARPGNAAVLDIVG